MTGTETTATPTPGDDLAERAAAFVRGRAGGTATVRVAIVLGTGLGEAVRGDLRAAADVPMPDIPGFAPPIAPGHEGHLLVGDLDGVPTAIFTRRHHLYEGHGMGPVLMVPRLAAALGARVLILTNAAGGLDRALGGGRLVLVRDHINLMGVNPLLGWRMPDGMPAFVALGKVYDPDLLRAAAEAADHVDVSVRPGVYAALSGPAFETPAEVGMLARLGADVVGMSTVPEAVAAVALGLRVLAISCVTNASGTQFTDEEVRAVAESLAPALRAIVGGVLAKLV